MSATAIPAPIYEIAKFVADKRSKATGDLSIHVDAIAAKFATSRRFKQLDLLHTFSVRQAGRDTREVPACSSADYQTRPGTTHDSLPRSFARVGVNRGSS